MSLTIALTLMPYPDVPHDCSQVPVQAAQPLRVAGCCSLWPLPLIPYCFSYHTPMSLMIAHRCKCRRCSPCRWPGSAPCCLCPRGACPQTLRAAAAPAAPCCTPAATVRPHAGAAHTAAAAAAAAILLRTLPPDNLRGGRQGSGIVPVLTSAYVLIRLKSFATLLIVLGRTGHTGPRHTRNQILHTHV
eukprot:1150632-Pelagomonas_calceolata.AAC.2